MSHRRTALIPAAALAAVTLAGPPLSSAASASPACEGKTATIVVTNDNVSQYWTGSRYEVRGTEGDDVIVSTVTRVADIEVGTLQLLGLGGDDTICTGPLPRQWAEEDAYYDIGPYLDGGAGSDILVGSTESEVYAYTADASGGSDTIKDPGGVDLLDQGDRAGEHVPVTTDVPSRTVTGAGVQVRWEGVVEEFRAGDGDEFLGGPGPEQLAAHGTDIRATMGAGDDFVDIEGAGPQHVSTGDGDDVVRVAKHERANANVDLGAGHDRIYFAGDVDADGAGGNDTFYPSSDGTTWLDAHVLGGPGTDRINFTHVGSGVRAYLDRGPATFTGGAVYHYLVDRITGSRYADVLAGDANANQISGNAGNDRLVGRAGNDSLAGDAGRDRAEGDAGADRCSAEVRVSC